MQPLAVVTRTRVRTSRWPARTVRHRVGARIPKLESGSSALLSRFPTRTSSRCARPSDVAAYSSFRAHMRLCRHCFSALIEADGGLHVGTPSLEVTMDQLRSSQPLEDPSPEQDTSRKSAPLARQQKDAPSAPWSATASGKADTGHRLEAPRGTQIILSLEEIYELTRYRAAAKQLEELRRQGFHRARIGRSGLVVLERAHFEAVCRGLDNATAPRPKVRPYRSKQHEKGRRTPA